MSKNMSNKRTIYLSSYDVQLRHDLDRILSLEKQCYDTSDLTNLDNIIDVLQTAIDYEIENKVTDHSELCLRLQELNDEFATNLSKKIIDDQTINIPFTSKNLFKLSRVEYLLSQDIAKNNEKVFGDINNPGLIDIICEIKNSINTFKYPYTDELAVEAEEIKAKDISFSTNTKLIAKYQNLIEQALIGNSNAMYEEQKKLPWAQKYNINYGLFGSDLANLINLTSRINKLYGSFNDTSDYEALAIFTNIVIETIESINEVDPAQRQNTLNTNIANKLNEIESEDLRDKIITYKNNLAELKGFSTDNYQFTDDDINSLQNKLDEINEQITELNRQNEEIGVEINAKLEELNNAKIAYENKHNEDPNLIIDPINENQPLIINDANIDEYIKDIDDVISQEFPFIEDWESALNNYSEIGLNENPRQRVVTIINDIPELHKDCIFSIEPISEYADTYEVVNAEDREFTIQATGTGNIRFYIVATTGDNVVKQTFNISVEKNNIEDFTLTYDNETPMNANETRTITVTSIEPNYHKETPFIRPEDTNEFTVEEFNEQTGETTIKALGTGDISFTIKNGEIEKEVNISVNIIRWYIGKDADIVGFEYYGESHPDYPDETWRGYNVDINTLPTIIDTNEIYTDHQQLEDTYASVYIVCPNELCGHFELIDNNDNNIPLTDETKFVLTNIEGYKLLMSGEIADTEIRVVQI